MKRARLLLVLLVLAATVGVLRVVGAVGSDSAPARLTGSGERYAVSIALVPARTGVVEADLDVASGGVPAAAGTVVSLSAAMPSMGHAMPEIAAEPERPGRFRARGEFFAMPGAWELTIRIHGAAGADAVTIGISVQR
ncbi:hypothetical protein GCM10022225_37220 [Plantactinospora mayteni]|uniref:YtkA-like domain-containing protein n=1 Tax=Plantactinospora mayteni TaxID=566021 RepID=A0ABQ4EKM7_9ACTN|nr:hypothetical protein [Plantactinospora mayteni]GIG95302.1 hypothetical protein Pma05_18750 [Plantactinospora mayteni]